ncbi:hypothetical protein [uncultured Desulfobacter sp.]|uniref:hypothetical protein n=1 Tax=uncultured Desulfobacter sp. TaxID=240139 RepID=UPI002AAB5130|nr:hypothetical protein [uncultured Desulfobacter sp.]
MKLIDKKKTLFRSINDLAICIKTKRATFKRQPVLKKEGECTPVIIILITVCIAFAATANCPALDSKLASEPDLNMTPELSNGNLSG